MIALNERIRRIRKEVGLSQRAFADKIGVTGSSVNKLESGENNPSDQTIKLICSEFKISPLYLEEGIEPMFVQPDEEVAALAADVALEGSDTAKAFLKIIATLSEDELALLEKMARRIVKELGD